MVSSDLSTEGNIMKKISVLTIVFGLILTAVYGNKQEKEEPEKWVIRDENGNKKIEFELKSGIKHGRATWWHENGKIKITGLYKNDKREGKWTSWDPDGKKYSV
jgi:antitoxin component YwqK of YwqJK toxin-antitoxin module